MTKQQSILKILSCSIKELDQALEGLKDKEGFDCYEMEQLNYFLDKVQLKVDELTRVIGKNNN